MSQVFNYQTIGAKHRCLPSAPFIVPAALDALRSSDFAPVTEFVLGEADAYCAKKAREVGAIILTSDSDLLVYDIGSKGRVALFEHVHLDSDKKPCKTLEARTLQHSEVAKRMKVPSLQRLAFEVKQHHNTGLCEVIRCAQQSNDTAALQEFLQSYDIELNNNPAHDMFGFLLDTRLSELAFQLQLFTTNTSSVDSMPVSSVQPASSEITGSPSTALLSRSANFYLPFLLDDPSRVSSWACSSSTRQIAYSLLSYPMSNSPNLNSIIEFNRKGQRTVGQEIFIPSTALLDTDSQSFIFQARHLLSQTQQDLAAVSVSKVQEQLAWYFVALKEVYAWYIRSNKNPPRGEVLLRAITGSLSTVLTWEDIHLGAQVQAVLYAFRMLKQSIACFRFCHVCAGPEMDDFEQVVRSLESLLCNLPDLKDMPLSGTAVQRLVVDMKIDARKMHDIIIGCLGKEELAELEMEAQGIKGRICGETNVAKTQALALAAYDPLTNFQATKEEIAKLEKQLQGIKGKVCGKNDLAKIAAIASAAYARLANFQASNEEIAKLEKKLQELKICGEIDADKIAIVAALALAVFGRPLHSTASKEAVAELEEESKEADPNANKRKKKNQGEQGKRRKIDEQKASNRFSYLDMY